MLVRARVEPHRLQHDASTGVEELAGLCRPLPVAGGAFAGAEVGDVDPVNEVICFDVTGWRDVPGRAGVPGLGGACEARSERVVLVEQGLHEFDEPGQVEFPWGGEENRLADAVEVPAVFVQGMHDRGQRRVPGGRLCGASTEFVVRAGHHFSKRRNGFPLEHLPRSDPQPGPARLAHQLDGDDAVAAEGEEAVVHADPVQAEHFGEQSGQDLLTCVPRLAI